MPLPCKKPRVSIDRDNGQVFVWVDESDEVVGLRRGRDGRWTNDVPTADELKDYFEPVYEFEEAKRWSDAAVAAMKPHEFYRRLIKGSDVDYYPEYPDFERSLKPLDECDARTAVSRVFWRLEHPE